MTNTDELLTHATPRPWRYEPQGNVIVEAATRAFVVDCNEAGGWNHELIVRAANSFEAMRAALAGMVARFQPDSHFPELDAARAALALADGTEG